MSDETIDKFGSVMVDIVGTTPKPAMLDSKKYCLEIIAPKDFVKSAPKMKTSEASPKNANDWSLHAVMKLEAEIHSGVAFTMILKEIGTFSDDQIASGVFSVGVLADGQRMEAKVDLLELAVKKGQPSAAVYCTVSVCMDWEGGLPPYISKPGVEDQQTAKELSPLPESEGRAYSVRVIAHKARNLQSNDDNAIYNPLVSVTIGDETRKTESLKGDNNPYFDEELMFMLPKAEANFWSMPIQINVMHNPMIGPKKLIGMGQMDMAAVYRSPQHFMQNKWLVLRKGELSTQIMGFLKVSVMVLDALKDTIPEMESEGEEDDENEEETVMGLLNAPGAAFEEVYMRCEIYKAIDVPKMDSNFLGGSCDPMVKVHFGVKKTQVAHKTNTLAPVWNTATSLAALLPSMTDNIFIELWDFNKITSNNLIATHKLNFNNLLTYGSNGLPAFPARYVSLYGSPSYRGSNSDNYFDKMDKGLKGPVDYRGRLLVGIMGTRDKSLLSGSVINPQEMTVDVTVIVQVNQFSMLPTGAYTIRLVLGPYTQSSREFMANRMNQSVSMLGDLGAVYIGEEISISGAFQCICQTIDGTRAEAAVVDQIPDVFIHVMQKDKIFASTRLPASALLPKDTSSAAAGQLVPSDSTGKPRKNYSYYCTNFATLVDPEKIKEGKAPVAPLGQFYISMKAGAAKSFTPPILPDAPLTFKPFDGLGEAAVPPRKNQDKDGNHRLEVCVYQARQVPAGDSNGLSDPYVRVCWGNAAETTSVKEETLNPFYNEMLIIDAVVTEKFPDLVVELWDWDRFGSNTFLARAILPFKQVEEMNRGRTLEGGTEVVAKEWIKGFKDSKGRDVDSDVLMAIEIQKLVSTPDSVSGRYPVYYKKIKLPKGRAADGRTNIDYYPVPESKALKMCNYKFSLNIFALRKMKKYRYLDLKAPSIEVECGGLKAMTDKRPGPNPDINEKMECIISLPKNTRYMPQLNIKVFDNRLGSKALVGSAVVSMDDEKYDPTRQIELQQIANQAVAERLEKHRDAKFAIMHKDQPAVIQAVRVEERVQEGMIGNVLGFMKKGTDGLTGLIRGRPSVSNEAAAYREPATEEYSAQFDENGEPLDADGAVEKMKENQDKEFDKLVDNPYEGHNENVREEKSELRTLPPEAPEDLEIPWFDKFDPLEPIDPLEMVSRLHKLVENPADATCEIQYGPFNDEHDNISLYRGYGKKRIKAGEICLMFTLTPEDRQQLSVKMMPTKLINRKNVEFVARVYIMSCSHLAAKDNSIFGSASDPYPVLTLSDGSGTTDKDKFVKLACKDDKKFQTLNPEYYIMREIKGTLPQHGNLRIEIFDWNKMMSDELIGFTDVNLEDRWFSTRGYLKCQKQGGTLFPGSYTEKRDLRDEQGQVQGRIELWIDMFSAKSSIPLPIAVAPYPPIAMEFRVIVWSVRDCVLQDVSIHGEAMTDIYVRCWMNGMRGERQETDVHYRSLDGSGTFNWRMVFPFVFDPRSKKIMPAKASGGLSSFFRIKKEQRKLAPSLKVQIFDNDFFPGTDDFIGETSLNILKMRPTITRRNGQTILDDVVGDVRLCCNDWCCCLCGRKEEHKLSLEEKQQLAVEEFKRDLQAQRKEWASEAERRLEALKGQGYSEPQMNDFRNQFIHDARRKSLVNALEAFTPKMTKKKKGAAEMIVPQTPVQMDDVPHEDKVVAIDGGATSPSDDTEEKEADKPSYEDSLPAESETPKYWFACRGPRGACRVGDVQLSFAAVRSKPLKKEVKLEAGRGRHEPQALPPPDRPESSFFFLTSPFKSAVYIIWKNYKYYILLLLCCLLLLLILYAFVTRTLSIQADNIFDANPKPADIVVRTV